MIFEKFLEQCKKISGEYKELLEKPKREADLAIPCFSLTDKFKKNPDEIAEKLSNEFKKRIKKGSLIKEVRAVGPYVNFYINEDNFSKLVLKQILKDKRYGSSKIGKKKTIVIDFSCPNIGKPMHVGHIRSTIIGDALAKIFEFCGFRVVRFNYFGDIGTQVGKLLVAIELWGDEKQIAKNPEMEMLKLYVRFHEEAEKNPELEQKAQEKLLALENILEKARGDKKLLALWKKLKKWSISGFEKNYKLLGVRFDEYSGESFFGKDGKKIVKKMIQQKIAFEKDSAIVVDLEKHGLPNTIVLKSNEIPLYITRDLALAKYKYEKYKFWESVYVTGSEQSLHFRQVFKILELLGYKWSKDCKHIPFGLLSLPEGRIATREGRVVFLKDVLNKAIKLAKDEMTKRNEKTKNAKSTGIGAVKYAIIKVDPVRDMQFRWESVLNFEGDSGPYLQYTYARAKSILRKTKKKAKIGIFDTKEIPIIKKLSDFPGIVKKCIDEMKPHDLANYLFQLASQFNEYYHSVRVIGSDKENERLALVSAVATTIGIGLNLLGIDVLEKM